MAFNKKNKQIQWIMLVQKGNNNYNKNDLKTEKPEGMKWKKELSLSNISLFAFASYYYELPFLFHILFRCIWSIYIHSYDDIDDIYLMLNLVHTTFITIFFLSTIVRYDRNVPIRSFVPFGFLLLFSASSVIGLDKFKSTMRV